MGIPKLLVVVLTGYCLSVIGTVAQAQSGPVHPLTSSGDSSWQVEYAKGKGKKGNVALRLNVGVGVMNATADEVSFATATLFRFRSIVVDPADPMKEVYKDPTSESGGVVSLTGKATPLVRVGATASATTHWEKAPSDFLFFGSYTNAEKDFVLVTVRGVYHPGRRNKASGANARKDDSVTFHVSEKKFGLGQMSSDLAPLGRFMAETGSREELLRFLIEKFEGSTPCDEAPPADAAVEESYTVSGTPTTFAYTPVGADAPPMP